MSTGYLALVLHAHLPFVRHPEHRRSLEERWLFEAIAECYLPLTGVLLRLRRAGIPTALTLSLSPPLLSMLRDDLLRHRFEEHLTRMQALASREVERRERHDVLRPVAQFYVEHLHEVQQTWQLISGDLVGAWVKLHEQGNLELITSSVSHAYLPGLAVTPTARRAQIRLGLKAFEKSTGLETSGMWLPECAYDRELDIDLSSAGVRYTFLDSHGIRLSTPRSPFDQFAPIASPNGVAYFGRDPESSRQVWSRTLGYPGDPHYRDFYRDLGFDLPESELAEEIGPDGVRIMTGLKFFRITGAGEHKAPYDPAAALSRAKEHAAHFLASRSEQVQRQAPRMPLPPLLVAPYDAELFGHWWFEGPAFLEELFRQVAANRSPSVELITPRRYLEQHPLLVRSAPAPSSWGNGGHGQVWIGPSSAYAWRHVHQAGRYVRWLLDRNRGAQGPRGEALDQALRELLLLSASDWAFIITSQTASQYAHARIRAHVHRLRHLGYLVERSALTEDDVRWIRDLAARDNFLPILSGEDLRSGFDPQGTVANAAPPAKAFA